MAEIAGSAPGEIDDLPGPYEILEAQALIEGEAAALAAKRMTNAALDQLGEWLRTQS